MIEGLEGFKILNSTTIQELTVLWLLGILLLVIGIIVIISSIWFNYSSNYSDVPKWVTAIAVALFIIGVILIKDNRYYYKQYKITPIDNKYYIDLNMYDIVSSDEEIITIREIKTFKKD